MVWRRAFSGAAVSESLSEALLGLFVLLVATSFAWGAQTATPESSTATSSSKPSVPDDQRIRVEVKEVQIPFTVVDNKGNLVLDIPQKDFQVFENGVEQEIRYFSAPANLPLRFGILIDTSSSTRPRLKFEKEAAMQLGYYVLGHNPDHQGFLMTFDHTPEVAQDFTTNPDHLTTAI
ncbi:MAG: VWA domain-containing protein, partial [Acidobacteria bacterium]|nr:VWA domain-containing protein [Acidobacteriota bacterium]